MNTPLTTTEISLIKSALNYNTREAQLGDNYSNLGLEEASKILGVSISDTIKTLNGSNYFWVEDRDEVKGRGGIYPKHAIVNLNDEAVNAYFDHLEAEEIKSLTADGFKTLSEIEFELFFACVDANFTNSLWASNKVMYKRNSPIVISFETTEKHITMTILNTTTDTKDRYTIFAEVDNTKQIAHLKEAILFSVK